MIDLNERRAAGLLAAAMFFYLALLLWGRPVAPDGGEGDHLVAAAAPAGDMGAAPNCRYGVAALSAEQMAQIGLFQAGWYLSFEAKAVGNPPPDVEFARSLVVRQNKDDQGNYLPGYTVKLSLAQLQHQLELHPGSLWIIGNEVDRGPDPGQTESPQGDMFPEVYAQAYHDLYHFIKEHDPTAQVANSALVQVTPGRLQYLDLVWAAYEEQYHKRMPVDVWNMHLYILPEARPDGQPNGVASIALGTDPALAIGESYDPDGDGPLTPADTCALDNVYCWAEHDDLSIFVEQVVAMRTWMKEHYQQNKPLILSEFSILYAYEQDPGGTCYLQDEYGQCFTPQRVSQFAEASLNYLQTQAIDPELGYPADNFRLVQQWLWYSLHAQIVGSSSNLLLADLNGYTLPGQTFHDYVAARPRLLNLSPARVAFPAVPGGANNLADVPLSVWVGNNGNHTAAPFTVTFYEDAALQQPIGSVVVEDVRGCARREVQATIIWSDVPFGVHYYWTKVDSANVIPETEEQDNVAMGMVIVNPYQTMLPVIVR